MKMESPVLFVFLLIAACCSAQSIDVDITPGHETNRFVPNQTLGAGIDRIPVEAIDKDLTPEALKPVFTAGWGPVTFRQNTELMVQAWHWNPKGTWSDPSGKGYFTGATDSTDNARYSYGYDLPHRGMTRNDGTGNSGFSRLTDGDLNTFGRAIHISPSDGPARATRRIPSGLWLISSNISLSTPFESRGLIRTRLTF